jgi:diguanylate cyclase (GGDEF)-like protein
LYFSAIIAIICALIVTEISLFQYTNLRQLQVHMFKDTFISEVPHLPMRKFTRLTLIQKLIVSFVVSGLFMMASLIYSVVSMNEIRLKEDEIAHNDLSVATTTLTLYETLLAQDRLVGKYQILHQPEFRELYLRNAARFSKGLALIRPRNQGPVLTALVTEYARYEGIAERIFTDQVVSPSVFRTASERVDKALGQLRKEQQISLERKLAESEDQEKRTVLISTGLAIGGVVVAFLIAFLMIFSFANSIGKLQRATHRIAAGDFSHDPGIPPGDEIGSLAQDFSRMAERLKELEQLSLDASPLTRLPGNIAIERALNRRLREGAPFTMCYMDLDNFKSYNDHYGYIKASELLKETGQLIHDAVTRLKDPDAFVGHIGGDDFVAIVSADKAEALCQDIIKNFDAMVPTYYSEEDRAAGVITGVDRYGVPRLFPLGSISIAALVCCPGDYTTAAEIATTAAGVKDHVKASAGSNYIIVEEAVIYDA